jgi:hypothetical protein
MLMQADIELANAKWRKTFEPEPPPATCVDCTMLIYRSTLQELQYKGRYYPHINTDCEGRCNGCHQRHTTGKEKLVQAGDEAL